MVDSFLLLPEESLVDEPYRRSNAFPEREQDGSLWTSLFHGWILHYFLPGLIARSRSAFGKSWNNGRPKRESWRSRSKRRDRRSVNTAAEKPPGDYFLMSTTNIFDGNNNERSRKKPPLRLGHPKISYESSQLFRYRLDGHFDALGWKRSGPISAFEAVSRLPSSTRQPRFYSKFTTCS